METPLLKQYTEMKKKHPDAVLLFRVGDFYETFSDDAIEVSRILGITLTRRAKEKVESVELAGFPHRALDTYLPKLIRAGKRVAICEQLEDPKLVKKPIKRNEISIPKKEPVKIFDFTPIISLLSLFGEAMGQLYIFKEIRCKTEEIRALSRKLRLSPKLAFNACYDEITKPKQLSIFE